MFRATAQRPSRPLYLQVYQLPDHHHFEGRGEINHMQPSSHRVPRDQGFTLIMISILLAVASIIVVSFLPGVTSDSEKARITKERMGKIEEAAHTFMASYQRRPCPADAWIAVGQVNFGVEAAGPGRCTGGTPAANFVNAVPASGTITGIGNTSVASSTIYTTPSLILSSLTPATGASSATAMIQVGAAVGSFVATASNVATGTRVTVVNTASNTITLNKPPALSTATGTVTFSANVNGNSIINPVVAGGVPTTSLGLSDEYAFDGYGRRMVYIVDNRATEASSCHDMLSLITKGAVRFEDTAASFSTNDNAMWALMSYGKSGHGAYPQEGGTTRINARSTDPDVNNNAFYTYSSGTWTSTATNSSNLFVRKEPVTTPAANLFDDIVWTEEKTKNTCCIGKYCNFGFRMDIPVAGNSYGPVIAVGDINGDGIPDLVMGDSPQNIAWGWYNVYVIFGSRTGWPMPPSVLYPAGGLNGVNGFVIKPDTTLNNGFFGQTLAVGDINGDGYDDIMIGGASSTGGANAVTVIYGGPGPRISATTRATSWPATYTASSTNFVQTPTPGPYAYGGSLLTVSGAANLAPGGVGIGDFTGHRLAGDANTKDFFVTAAPTATGVGFLVRGQSAAMPAAFNLPASLTATSNPAGVTVTTSDAVNTTIGGAVYPGDVNGDGIDDIIVQGPGGPGYTTGEIYLLFGRNFTGANSFASISTYGPLNAIDINAEVSNSLASGLSSGGFPGTSAVRFYWPGTYVSPLAIGDLNNDGIKDIMFPGQLKAPFYLGKTAGWPTSPYNFNTATNLFSYSTLPGWLNGASGFVAFASAIGDVNGDGKSDVLLDVGGGNTAVVCGTSSTTLCGTYSNRTNSAVELTYFQPTGGFAGTEHVINGAGAPTMNGSTGFYILGGTNDNFIYARTSPVVADINGDGRKDIVLSVGQGSCVASGCTKDKLYVLYGRGNVPWDSWVDLGELDY